MEKLDYLLWADGRALREHLGSLDVGVREMSVLVGDTEDLIPAPTLLMGHGAELGAVVSVWIDSLDDRGALEDLLRATGARVDGYLVTESVPQPRQKPAAVTHFTWFRKPDRLTDEEFFHGWQAVHTPSSFALHPTRCEYVRDAVARCLTPGSPRVDAIVFEMFPTIEDYADPKRLFGSKEALDETSAHLHLFADYEDLNSRPLVELRR